MELSKLRGKLCSRLCVSVTILKIISIILGNLIDLCKNSVTPLFKKLWEKLYLPMSSQENRCGQSKGKKESKKTISWVLINFTCIQFPCLWAQDSYLQKLWNIFCFPITHQLYVHTHIQAYLISPPKKEERVLMKRWDKIWLQNNKTL